MFCRPFQIVFVGLAEVWTFTDTSSTASSARTLAKNILKKPHTTDQTNQTQTFFCRVNRTLYSLVSKACRISVYLHTSLFVVFGREEETTSAELDFTSAPRRPGGHDPAPLRNPTNNRTKEPDAALCYVRYVSFTEKALHTLHHLRFSWRDCLFQTRSIEQS